MKKIFILFLFCFFPSFMWSFSVNVSQGTDYFIQLDWPKVRGAEHYQILRKESVFLGKKGKVEAIDWDIIIKTYETSFQDTKVPGGMYTYKIVALDKNDNPIQKSETKEGYRLVNDTDFFLYFYETVEFSLNQFRTLKRINTDGETVKGLRDGDMTYSTSKLFTNPFTATVSYNKYQVNDISILGDQVTTLSKLISQRGISQATFEVDGIYKATVIYDLKIDWGKASGGNYIVQQVGSSKKTTLPWDIVEHPVDDCKYEDNLKHSTSSYEVEENK